MGESSCSSHVDSVAHVKLHKNPLVEADEGQKSGKLPRVGDWTDWSMVQLPDISTSINIFTWEGRERWDLEEMWAEYDPNAIRKKPFGLRTRGWANHDPDDDLPVGDNRG